MSNTRKPGDNNKFKVKNNIRGNINRHLDEGLDEVDSARPVDSKQKPLFSSSDHSKIDAADSQMISPQYDESGKMLEPNADQRGTKGWEHKKGDRMIGVGRGAPSPPPFKLPGDSSQSTSTVSESKHAKPISIKEDPVEPNSPQQHGKAKTDFSSRLHPQLQGARSLEDLLLASRGEPRERNKSQLSARQDLQSATQMPTQGQRPSPKNQQSHNKSESTLGLLDRLKQAFFSSPVQKKQGSTRNMLPSQQKTKNKTSSSASPENSRKISEYSEYEPQSPKIKKPGR